MEQIAYDYIRSGSGGLPMLGFLLGVIAGGVALRAPLPIKRAPYFALSSGVAFAMSLSNLWWMNLAFWADHDVAWVLICADVLAFFVGGIFLVLIAKGRAVDAFGNPRYAVLGLIPILNFWLLLKASKDRAALDHVETPIVFSSLTVILGFAFIGGIEAVEHAATSVRSEPTYASRLEKALFYGEARAKGVDATVKSLVAEFEILLPKKYSDGITTLVAVEAIGDTFVYQYQIDSDFSDLIPQEVISNTVNGNCDQNGGVRQFLDIGVKIMHSYVNRNGESIGSFLVDVNQC